MNLWRKLTKNNKKVVKFLLDGGILTSSKIYQEIIKAGEEVSLVTVKRILSRMALVAPRITQIIK